MKRLVVVSIITLLLNSVNGQSTNLDTIRNVIFVDSTAYISFFQPGITFSSLTKSELSQLEKILTKAIEESNTSSKKYIDSVKSTRYYDTLRGLVKIMIDSWMPIELADYKRQLIIGLNFLGEKEVWVNCLRLNRQSEMTDGVFSLAKQWRKRIVTVSGGGSDYFNVVVNLTNNTYHDLIINGPM